MNSDLISIFLTFINALLPKGFYYQLLTPEQAALNIFIDSDDAETLWKHYPADVQIVFSVRLEKDGSLAFLHPDLSFTTSKSLLQILPPNFTGRARNLAAINKSCYNLTPLQRAAKFCESNDELLTLQQISYPGVKTAHNSERLFCATLLDETELREIETTHPEGDYWHTLPLAALPKTQFGVTADEALTKLIDSVRFGSMIVDADNRKFDPGKSYRLDEIEQSFYGLSTQICSFREEVSREHNLVEILIDDQTLIVDGKFLTVAA